MHNPARLSGICIKTLLLPRILNPQSTTSIKSAFVSSETILATLAFAVVTAGVFMLRITFIKSKRAKAKDEIHIPKQAFPKAHIEKGTPVISTVFFAALLTGAYFMISLILKKKWKDMPVTVDLAICAGNLILLIKDDEKHD